MSAPVSNDADTTLGRDVRSTAALADRACRYLRNQALPFWSERGVHANGCFVEHLDLRGTPVDPGFTRVRVQARQLYVFSHAHVANIFSVPDLLPRSVDFFLKAAWLGPERGWARRISRTGEVIDDSYDLYDVAFALFALAWSYRVDPEPRLLRIASETLDFLDRRARHPEGGYRNDSGPLLPRLQNPHMHLAEAAIAWFQACGSSRFLDVAGELVALCGTRFTDQNGALGEYFAEDWAPLAGAPGGIVEPGHQLEWAWLIGEYAKISSADVRALIERLTTFAFRHGLNHKTGLTKDQVDRSGRILDAGHRLWPQTEAIKGCIAAERWLGIDLHHLRQRITEALFEYFLDRGPIPGTWIDHYNDDWTIRVDKIPATSLYHVTLAFLSLTEQT